MKHRTLFPLALAALALGCSSESTSSDPDPTMGGSLPPPAGSNPAPTSDPMGQDDGLYCSLEHIRSADSSTVAGPWTTPRYGAAAVGYQGDLIVVGGSAETGLLGQIDRYDVESDAWTTVATGLLPRRYPAAVVVDDDLYVLSGDIGSDQVTNRVERIDLTTFAVEELAPHAIAREFAGAAVYDGAIYLAGGSTDNGRTDSVERFDLASQTWGSAPALGEARDTRLLVVGGELLALGGFAGSGTVEWVEAFETSGWSVVTSMSPASSAFSAASVGGSLWVFGDFSNQGQVLAYDRGAGSWEELDVPFAERRHSAAAAVDEDTIVVFGGNNASMGSWTDVVDVYGVACAPR